MGFHELQYKKLLSELKFKNEELEIIEESMREIHLEFEQYYADFLKEKDISKQELEKSDTKQFQNFKEKVLKPQMPETDETGLVVEVELRFTESQEYGLVYLLLVEFRLYVVGSPFVWIERTNTETDCDQRRHDQCRAYDPFVNH